MKVENRVFFGNEKEALSLGYRPCGQCMPDKYKEWKPKKTLTVQRAKVAAVQI
jgi:methylphosphotriester-DNA--protein-cysteine methyltransferase